MIVAPSEPKPFSVLGDRSQLPEEFGCDFLTFHDGNITGVQRKEATDLVASLNGSTTEGGNRMSRLMHQMKELHRGWLLIEGNFRWGHDGTAGKRGCEGFTRARYDDVLNTAQANGIWVAFSTGIEDSIRVLRQIEHFMTHPTHDNLYVRPKPRGTWGTARDRDWGAHAWQSFPGIGYGLACALYDSYGVPWQWTPEFRAELLSKTHTVRGLGPKRKKALLAALPEDPT